MSPPDPKQGSHNSGAGLHLLIVALGSAGDVHPFLAIGRSALARGHRVSLCTSPAFQALVEACGLRFLPVGTAAEYEAAMADPALWHPRSSLRTLWRVLAPSVAPLFDLLRQEVRASRAAGEDVAMLGSLWAFSARVLQEAEQVPYLSAQVSPSTLLSAMSPPTHAGFSLPAWWPPGCRRLALWLIERRVIDPLIAPDLERLRRGEGLAPTRRILGRWVHSPQGVLALFPPWLAPVQPDWPHPLHFAGFGLFEPPSPRPEGALLDDGLQAFLDAGPAPVVVTAGSTLLRGQDFFSRALEAVAGLGLRAVFIGAESLMPVLPSTVLQRRFVPLRPLLERSAALLHHGGIGTTAFAFAAGVPQLLMPFAHDQFDNACRVVAQACGLQLPSNAGSHAIAGTLSRLLTDEAVHASCDRVRAWTLRDSGAGACARAVDLLEALARGQGVAAPPGPAGPLPHRPPPSRVGGRGCPMKTTQPGAVVVLYKPSPMQLTHVGTLAAQGVPIVAVDNSPTELTGVRACLQAAGVHCIANRNQGGIARAFNLGITALAERGVNAHVLLDQDSVLPRGYFEVMAQAGDACRTAGHERFILGPKIFDTKVQEFLPTVSGKGSSLRRLDVNAQQSGHDFASLLRCSFLISSGCVVSDDAWQTLGRFREDFVIDHVDTEYCLRAVGQGVSMFIVPSLTLRHTLGDRIHKRFAGVRIGALNHDATRRYYLARNGLALWRLHPSLFTGVAVVNLLTLHQLLAIWLLESNKRIKTRALLRGWIDGLLRRSGPMDALHPELARRCAASRDAR